MVATTSDGRTEEESEEGRLKGSGQSLRTLTVNSSDESFAWKSASLVMLLLSFLAIGLRLLERAFFSPEFEVSLVYVPTAVLFAVWLLETMRGRRVQA